MSSSKGANRCNLSGNTGCNVNDRDRAIVLRGGFKRGGYIIRSIIFTFVKSIRFMPHKVIIRNIRGLLPVGVKERKEGVN